MLKSLKHWNRSNKPLTEYLQEGDLIDDYLAAFIKGDTVTPYDHKKPHYSGDLFFQGNKSEFEEDGKTYHVTVLTPAKTHTYHRYIGVLVSAKSDPPQCDSCGHDLTKCYCYLPF